MVKETPEAKRILSDEKQPEFVLFATSSAGDAQPEDGSWRIMLGDSGGEIFLDVEETETGLAGERLDLLSVIRGLEALAEPSSVTLFTSSRYVQRGLRFGLDTWRRASWCWERFGRMVPIKNRDLWQRLDHALQYHQLECRYWRFNHNAQENGVEPGETHAA